MTQPGRARLTGAEHQHPALPCQLPRQAARGRSKASWQASRCSLTADGQYAGLQVNVP